MEPRVTPTFLAMAKGQIKGVENAGKGARIGYMKKFGVVLILLLVLQVLLGGCGDDDPTDEWIGTWALEMWDGDNWTEETLKVFKDALYDGFVRAGRSRELAVKMIPPDEIEVAQEFTFDNNSRWEYKEQFKTSLAEEIREGINHPEKDVREAAAELVELFDKSLGDIVVIEAGSYVVTGDRFTMTGDRTNTVFTGLMSGVWKRDGNKLTLIGDKESELGGITLSKK